MLATIEVVKPTIIEHPKVAPATPTHARATAATHPRSDTPTQVTKEEKPEPLLKPTPPTEVVDGPVGPATPATAAVDAGGVPGSVGDATTGPPATAATSSEPFVYVEKMPEFAGGQAALLRYLRSHLRYPSGALAAAVGGRVFLSFVVGADGAISEVTILKGLGYGLDEEAQRVVRQMPAWTPGYQSKHAVPVRFTLPITFQYQ